MTGSYGFSLVKVITILNGFSFKGNVDSVSYKEKVSMRDTVVWISKIGLEQPSVSFCLFMSFMFHGYICIPFYSGKVVSPKDNNFLSQYFFSHNNI